MACTHPVKAWQSVAGGPVIFREPLEAKDGQRFLKVPCGLCLSCRMARARAWAIRCTLELQSHRSACWATLTYDDKHLPPTLDKPAFSGFLKRLRSRSTSPIRFFGCGEYGERNGRPHYHVILYGTQAQDLICSSWNRGHVRVDELSPAAIAYVAGYATKKANQYRRGVLREERVCEDTGEVYFHQDPFLLMSRRPGIGANAREWWQSWRTQAIWQNKPVPVPRYLHEAWKANATPAMHEARATEVAALIASLDLSHERLAASAEMALAKHSLSGEARRL